ncbi:MAG: YbbR-like domain-containing protein [Ignavibacteriae bacterium]|nr:YbbR-like domain-containing protein [Ignavibacteriota bacterium]NOG97378.1 YbbR-like domain-containing protein [Ignavibacteriota bacterium]
MNKKIITIILIFIFSIVLWGSISLSKEYFTSLSLPIEFIDLSDDYSINTDRLKKVSVSLKGDGWSLLGLALKSKLKFIIRPQDEEGRQVISSRNEIEQNDWLPSNVQVVEVQPDVIEFDVEKISFKRVPIEKNISIQYKNDYGIISTISISPDSVDISGPESKIKNIEKIKTEFTEFNNVDKSVSANVPLEKIKSIEYYYNFTRVEFDVQKIVDKTFENVEVETRNVPSSKQLDLFPSKIRVVLRGGINVLGKIASENIKPYVTFNQALNDTLGAIIPTIDVPEFTEVIVIKPSKLDYIIKQY